MISGRRAAKPRNWSREFRPLNPEPAVERNGCTTAVAGGKILRGWGRRWLACYQIATWT
jgi:hypothetical protein